MINTLDRDFSFLSFLKFTLPTISMLILLSLYTIIDGIIVARFVGTDALSAINIIFPYISLIIGITIMFATGGSAVIATQLGQKKEDEARNSFTIIVISAVSIALLITIFSTIFLEEIVIFLGGTGILFEFSKDYGRLSFLFSIATVLQGLFQYFFVMVGKQKLGLIFTGIAGLSNMILDYVFIVPFNLGIAGAALATGLSACIPSIAGLIYFSNKKNIIHFIKPTFKLAPILKTVSNGSSEMLTNISTGITTFLFNFFMLKYLGSNGVAAITIILYTQYLLTATYIGFSSGCAPIISYNYGKENYPLLKKVSKYSLIFLISSSITIYIFTLLFTPKIIEVFSPQGSDVYNLAIDGMSFFSIVFLFAGFNIFASSFFTAFSNGFVSAVISFFRSFIFLVGGIFILTYFFKENSIWMSVPIAETLSFLISLYFVKKYKNRYKY